MAAFSAPVFSCADPGAKLASAAYITELPLSHALWPEGIWTLALIFLWLMLVPSPCAALRFGSHRGARGHRGASVRHGPANRISGTQLYGCAP